MSEPITGHGASLSVNGGPAVPVRSWQVTPPSRWRRLRRFLYLEFWWAMHNLIAHPVSQLLWWLSLCGLIRRVARWGDFVHNCTVPLHSRGEGRG